MARGRACTDRSEFSCLLWHPEAQLVLYVHGAVGLRTRQDAEGQFRRSGRDTMREAPVYVGSPECTNSEFGTATSC